MLEDLTVRITEQVNGVKSTYLYRLEPMASTGFRHSADSIIGRLNKVFTRLGYKLSTDGTIYSSSTKNGEGSTLSKDLGNTVT